MIQGKVKFFRDDKGYGFIERDDGQPDIFFHRTALPVGIDRVQDGAIVNFDEADGKEGKKKATNIHVVV